MNIAVILAGGVGSRVGAGVPKQFVEVLGCPVICYTLEHFQNHPEIDAIEIVCVAPYMKLMRQIVSEYGFTKVRWIVEGGSTFQYSVRNGIFNLRDKLQDDDIVLLHYAVSPLVCANAVHDGIALAKEHGNAVGEVPMVLCTCLKEDEKQNFSDRPYKRELIAAINSPLCFKFALIYECYQRAERENIFDKIEPHTPLLLFYLGYRLYFYKSSTAQIKITYKEDLDLLAGCLYLKQQGKPQV